VDASRVCTEQTDETQRLFNDPDVSTSVDVRADVVAGGNRRSYCRTVLVSRLHKVGHGIIDCTTWSKSATVNRYDPNTKHCIKVNYSSRTVHACSLVAADDAPRTSHSDA
jgi:hypothetical protein